MKALNYIFFPLKQNLLHQIQYKSISTATPNPEWNETINSMWKKKVSTEDALKSLKNIITDQPENMIFLGQYCSMLHQNRQWSALSEACKLAEKTHKETLLPGIFNGLYFSEIKGDNKEVAKIIQKAKSKKLSPIEHRCLAKIYSRLGKKEDALKQIHLYFKSEEAKDDTLAVHEKITYELDCEKFEEALRSCNRLLKQKLFHDDVRFKKVLALKGLKKIEQAIIELSVLIGETQDSIFRSKLYSHRASLRANKEQAISDLEMSLSLCPEKERKEDELLFAYYSAGLYDKAEKLLNEIEKTKELMNNFKFCLVKADFYRFYKRDFKNALLWYHKVHGLSKEKFKDHFVTQIKIIEGNIKRESIAN